MEVAESAANLGAPCLSHSRSINAQPAVPDQRHSGGSRLTAAEEAYVRSSRQAIHCIDRALVEAGLAATGRAGVLHLGAWSICGGPLHELIADVARLNRDVTLRGTEANAETLKSQLLERADVVVCAGEVQPSTVWCLPRIAWRWLCASMSGCRESSRDSRLCLVAAGVGFLPLLERSSGEAPQAVRFVPITDPEMTVTIRLCWLPTSDHPPLRRFVSLARRRAVRAGPPPSQLRADRPPEG